jgi:Arc/MetJ family transcription regulator
MLTTLAHDDELVAKAQAFTGVKEKSSLVREALKALIEREKLGKMAFQAQQLDARNKLEAQQDRA